ncbi:MAG: AsmA family protein [Alphaproteobacteria bacterium]|jgi:hypothetical protein|nr:AsmA family protein [Alphaproteobacteria bacterium]
MGKKSKLGIGLAVVGSVGLVVTVVATLMSTDFNKYRGTIAAQVKAATGRDLVIAGDIELEFGLTSRLAVDDVRLANAPWGSRPEMLLIERLEAEVPLLSLASGELVVDRLVLVGADLLLETDEAGRGNWLFEAAGAAPEPGSPAVPALTDIRVEGASITYRDGARRHAVRIDHLTGHADGMSAPLMLDLSGGVDRLPLKLVGQLGAIGSLDAAAPFPVSLKLTLGGLAMTVEGHIAEPLEGKGLDLAVKASAKDLAALSVLAGRKLPELGPLEASLRLNDDDKGYVLNGLDAKLGTSDLAGDLRVALGPERPRVDGTVASRLLDLDAILAVAPGGAPAKKAKPDGRLFSAAQLPLSVLGALNGDIAYKAGQLRYAGLTLGDVAVAARLKQGAIDLAPLTATLANGRLQIDAAVDGAKTPAPARLRLKLEGADLRQLLLTAADSDLLSGRLDVSLDLVGSGGSVRQIMAGLGGRANMVVADGYIANQYVDLIAADLLASLAPWSKDAKGAKLHCIVADLPIRSGLARAKVLLLDTERMTVTGEGTVSLKSEKLDLKLKPKPKDPSLFSLATPVLVGGTIAEPTAVPDPVALATGAAAAVAGNVLLPGAGLLAPLLSAGSDDAHPCLRAVSAKGKAKPVRKAKGGKKEGAVGGFLKSLGKTIDKTLGVGKQ